MTDHEFLTLLLSTDGFFLTREDHLQMILRNLVTHLENGGSYHLVFDAIDRLADACHQVKRNHEKEERQKIANTWYVTKTEENN